MVVAALAGLGSFVAPCILPVVPAFLAYISGSTLSEMSLAGNGGGGRGNGKSSGGGAGAGVQGTVTINRTRIVLNSVFFVLGFSVVFSALGVVISGALAGSAWGLVQGLNQVGGAVIVGFGAFLILSTRIGRLNVERRFLPRGAKAGYPMSFVFGLAFAAGWTPCVGPVLGTILTLAATTPSAAFHLLLAYSLGLGVPFVLMGAFYSRATGVIRAMGRHLKYYNVALGGFIIVLGALVYANQLAYIANFPLFNELLLLG